MFKIGYGYTTERGLAVLIFKETIDKLIEAGIEVKYDLGSMILQTPSCEVEFIRVHPSNPAILDECRGRRYNATFGIFPDEISKQITYMQRTVETDFASLYDYILELES